MPRQTNSPAAQQAAERKLWQLLLADPKRDQSPPPAKTAEEAQGEKAA